MMMEFDDDEEDHGTATGVGNAAGPTAAGPGCGAGGGLRAADTPSKDQGLVSRRAGAGAEELPGLLRSLSCRDIRCSGVLEGGCCSRLAEAHQTPCSRRTDYVPLFA